MGEANIRYARGETEDAILMCMEIIRQGVLGLAPFCTRPILKPDCSEGVFARSL